MEELFDTLIATMQVWQNAISINKIHANTFTEERLDKLKYNVKDALDDYIDKRIELALQEHNRR